MSLLRSSNSFIIYPRAYALGYNYARASPLWLDLIFSPTKLMGDDEWIDLEDLTRFYNVLKQWVKYTHRNWRIGSCTWLCPCLNLLIRWKWGQAKMGSGMTFKMGSGMRFLLVKCQNVMPDLIFFLPDPIFIWWVNSGIGKVTGTIQFFNYNVYILPTA